MSGTLLAAVDESSGADAILRESRGAAVALFDTGGNWLKAARLSTELEARGVHVRHVETARLVDAEITALRDAVAAWSDALADTVAGGATVAQRLRVSGTVSAYWLSSLVERNPLKTPEILAAAIARTFDAELRRGRYDRAVILLSPGLLAQALGGIARAEAGSSRPSGRLAHAVKGLAAIARQAWWAVRARGLRLPPGARTDVLAITYFPYVDRAAAAEGRFVNRYAAPLQDLFASRGTSVAWLGLFVFVDGFSFRDATALARRFRENGAALGLVDAYVSPRIVWDVLIDFRRISAEAGRIERELGPALGSGLVPEGAEIIATEWWRRSFAGLDLARALMYFHVFARIVAETPAPRLALYLAEFQTWEQALNASARPAGWRTIAFQHTVVSKNHYFYWRSPRETRPDAMPLPVTVAAGGELPAEAFRARGMEAAVVESVRQLHLRHTLDGPAGEGRTPGLLIAGSIDRREMRAMLALTAAAFPDTAPMPIRVKAHPSMPAEPLIAELGLEAAPLEIVSGAVGAWLARSTFVLVGSSAVAVEALAHGCDVLVPAFASAPRLTPLAGWEELYRPVYSPEDLADALSRPPANARLARAFADRYWALDPKLPRWSAFLDAS